MPEARRLSRNIKNMDIELAERGRIKAGGKGEIRKSRDGNSYQLPVRYEQFVITTMVRGADNNFVRDEALHKALVERGFEEPLTVIPVRLLFNDPHLNFSSGYGIWDAKRGAWYCRGDGEQAQRLQDTGELTWIDCTCSFLGKQCKIQSKLRVTIDGASGLGGIWTFISTSWNSTRAIAASLAQLSMWTGGHVAGLPLRLVMRPKTVYPKGAPASTIQVVSLEFAGDMDQLLVEATKAMQLQVGYEKRLAELEKQILEADKEIIPAEDADEFYPEAEQSTAPEPEPEKTIRRRTPKQAEPPQSLPSREAPPPPLVAPSGNGTPPQAPQQQEDEDAGGTDEEECPF